MFRRLAYRLGGSAMSRRTETLGAAYLELARANRIEDDALVEFAPADVWKATPYTHRKILEAADTAAVALTHALASGLPLATAAARYGAAAARGSEDYFDRARAVLAGLPEDAARVGLAAMDFWVGPLAPAREAFAAIGAQTALTHAPVEAAAARWSAEKPSYAADLKVLTKSPAVGAGEALAIADLLLGHGRVQDVDPWFAAWSDAPWDAAQARERSRLLALAARAGEAGVDAGAPRALAVFDDEGAAPPSSSLPVVRVDRVHNRYARHGDDTWLIASGPHLEPGPGGIHQFPYHPGLRPVFVGWECHDVDVLTPEALEYLRAHGPVGCADARTLQILRSLDVPAFESGPLARPRPAGAAGLAAVVSALEEGEVPDDVRAAWTAAVEPHARATR